MEIKDELLVENYLAGDEAAFRIIVERHLKSVYNFAYYYAGSRKNAEDIAQEVFISIWKNIKKFDRKRNFKAWMFTIAKNTSINWLKKKKPAIFSDLEGERPEERNFAENIPDSSPSLERLFGKKELSERIGSLMKNLDPINRAVLSLHYEKNMSFREISEISGKPLHTVKSRHRRALLKLRKLISS